MQCMWVSTTPNSNLMVVNEPTKVESYFIHNKTVETHEIFYTQNQKTNYNTEILQLHQT
jgi:hypothetical protein